MAFDRLPTVGPLAAPALDVLRRAAAAFPNDAFHARVWAAHNGTVQAMVDTTDFDPLSGDSAHTHMALAALLRDLDAALAPLHDALGLWAGHLSGQAIGGFSLVVDLSSHGGAFGLVVPGFQTLRGGPRPDESSHGLTEGWFDRALRVAATLGSPVSGQQWSLGDAAAQERERTEVFAANAADAFALLGAYHHPKLWTHPLSWQWDLSQHHTGMSGYAGALERFG